MSKISKELKSEIKSDGYLIRYHACEKVLKENNISKSISNLRRISSIISENVSGKVSDSYRANFDKAVVLFEKYIENYGKPIDFKSLSKEELNELFLDECYDTNSLTLDKVRKFFENGADINYKDKRNGLTVFHYAAKTENIEILKEFLKKGANPNATYNSDFKQVIWLNNHDKSIEKVKVFLEFGANISETNGNNENILHFLSGFTNIVELAEFLISKGADLKKKNVHGRTPLFNAVRSNCVVMVELFLSKGADVNATDNDKITPLIEACNFNCEDCLKIILKYGGDKSAKDSKGKTCYEIALSKGYLNIAKLLEPEKYENDYKNGLEYGEIENYKSLIIEKFKNGKAYTTCDKEGSSELKLNEDGVYEYNYWSLFSEDDFTTIYKTDTELLNYLYREHSWKLNNEKTEKDIYKFIYNKL